MRERLARLFQFLRRGWVCYVCLLVLAADALLIPGSQPVAARWLISSIHNALVKPRVTPNFNSLWIYVHDEKIRALEEYEFDPVSGSFTYVPFRYDEETTAGIVNQVNIGFPIASASYSRNVSNTGVWAPTFTIYTDAPAWRSTIPTAGSPPRSVRRSKPSSKPGCTPAGTSTANRSRCRSNGGPTRRTPCSRCCCSSWPSARSRTQPPTAG